MSDKKARRFSLPGERLESLQEHAQQKASEMTLGGDVVADIPVAKLSPAPWNARRYFDEAALQALGEDLRDNGQIHPIMVRSLNDEFEIVVGERRYRAALLVGLPTLKATVRALGDVAAQRVSLVENLGREDLNSFEETVGFLQLLVLELSESADFAAFRQADEGVEAAVKRLLYSLFGKRQRSVNNVINEVELARLEARVGNVFKGVGVLSWTSFVQNRLPILELPGDVLEAVRSGRLAYTKAKLIAKIEDASRRAKLLSEAVALGLSGTELRRRINSLHEQDRGEADIPERASRVAKALRKKRALKDEGTRKKVERLLAKLEALLDDTEVETRTPEG